MKRSILFGLILALGCNQPEKQQATENTEPKTVNIPDDFDFKNWPKAMEEPYPVDPKIAAACETWTIEHRKEDGRKKHGPHFKPAIMVRTNPDAKSEFISLKSPVPVGTVIVKEKLSSDPTFVNKELQYNYVLASYGVMIKREAGYDPDHGDWEYMYVDLQPERKVTRGKLESCINCHMNVKEKDYLFRSYLKTQ